jgi:hypothetical protein
VLLDAREQGFLHGDTWSQHTYAESFKRHGCGDRSRGGQARMTRNSTNARRNIEHVVFRGTPDPSPDSDIWGGGNTQHDLISQHPRNLKGNPEPHELITPRVGGGLQVLVYNVHVLRGWVRRHPEKNNRRHAIWRFRLCNTFLTWCFAKTKKNAEMRYGGFVYVTHFSLGA